MVNYTSEQIIIIGAIKNVTGLRSSMVKMFIFNQTKYQ